MGGASIYSTLRSTPEVSRMFESNLEYTWFNCKGLNHVTQGHGFESFWSHTMQYHDSVDPHNRNLKLDVDSSTTECDRTHFRKLIGSLIYLLITGPDLNYSINFLSAFMQTHVILI